MVALSLILRAKELNEYWVLYNTTAQGFSVQLTVPTRIKSLSLSPKERVYNSTQTSSVSNGMLRNVQLQWWW